MIPMTVMVSSFSPERLDDDSISVEEVIVRPTHPAAKIKVQAGAVTAPTKGKKRLVEVVIERPRKLSKKTRDKSEKQIEDL
jgi:hypothetical protein